MSPPSLHANEEIEDSEDDELMETAAVAGADSAQSAPPIPPPAAIAPPGPPTNSDPLQASSNSSLPASNRSDTTSPYADDESFAMFVAQEANETASALEQDSPSLSPSPTPTPTPDPAPLPGELLLPYDSLALSCSNSALVHQYNIAASCHSTPFQLNEAAPTAVS